MSQSPIRAVIVDDENSGIEVLEYTLKRHCKDVEVIRSFTSSLEAAEAIPHIQPDVLFVDVEMPQMNGFELVEKLSKLKIQIVFTTAYNEFALKAFRVSALDYLLKPIDADELKSAVSKLKSLKKTFFKETWRNDCYSEASYQKQGGACDAPGLEHGQRQPSTKMCTARDSTMV